MMLNRFLIVGSLFALGLAASACSVSSEEDADSSEDEIRSALEITEAGNGKTFTVAKGKDIRVVLPANPTTGYKWKVVGTNRTFGYPTPREGTYEGPGAGGPVGGGGKQTFLWKTTSPLLRPSTTAHAVKLEYRRSFESASTPAAKTFTFKIKIKEGAAPPPPEPQAPVTLFEEHDGSTVRARVGQDLVVRLPSNPSTGYDWYVTSTNRTFGYPEKAFQQPRSSAPVGSGGTTVLTWNTDGPLNMVGTHRVAMKYSRGEGGAASKTYSFTVEVIPADADNDFTCPPAGMTVINCMPIVPATRARYCASDYRAWAQANCDVSYLD